MAAGEDPLSPTLGSPTLQPSQVTHDGAGAEPCFDFKPIAWHGAMGLRQGIIFHSLAWLLAKIPSAQRAGEGTPGLAGLTGPGPSAQGEETATAGGDFRQGRGGSSAANGCPMVGQLGTQG